VLFALSLGIIGLLRQEFVPAQDMSRFGIRFQTPVGSSLETSERVLDQIEAFLRTRPEVDMYGGFVGGFGGGEVNSGFTFVTLKEPARAPPDAKTGKRLSQQDLMNVARQVTSAIPGARIVMQDFSQRGFSATRGGGFPVEFNIRGRDWDELGRASRVIMEKMRESGLVTDINSDYQVGMPEVQVFPDRNKAADLGISMAEIGETINAAIGGERVGKFKDKGRRFDIRVRLLGQQRQRPEDIGRLLVRTASGGLVRLGDIVRIDQRPTLQTITRRDRERAITLTANMAPGVSQGVAIDRSMALAQANMPDGYRVVASGTARTFRESFDSLFFAMVLGLIVAYMVLASQFNAFTHPFTVLLALPFSVSGALVALWLAGQSINVYSMLGIILLMGIAKKNSILLVDFTNQARALRAWSATPRCSTPAR
jgi:multidrug efflux pump subunit AcrB